MILRSDSTPDAGRMFDDSLFGIMFLDLYAGRQRDLSDGTFAIDRAKSGVESDLRVYAQSLKESRRRGDSVPSAFLTDDDRLLVSGSDIDSMLESWIQDLEHRCSLISSEVLAAQDAIEDSAEEVVIVEEGESDGERVEAVVSGQVEDPGKEDEGSGGL